MRETLWGAKISVDLYIIKVLAAEAGVERYPYITSLRQRQFYNHSAVIQSRCDGWLFAEIKHAVLLHYGRANNISLHRAFVIADAIYRGNARSVAIKSTNNKEGCHGEGLWL